MTVVDRRGLQWRKGSLSNDDNHLAWQGHEAHILAVGEALMPEGGVFLDIGAHVGLWSLNLGLKAGSVYSIEANPATYATLVEHIDLNAGLLGETMFFPYQFAAWDRFEELSLEDPNGKETGGSTRCVPGGKATQGEPIDAAMGHVRPHFVKIDVEGAEHRVLRGMSGVVAEARPVFLIEMHDHLYGPECREETVAFLDERDYRWNDDLRYGEGRYIIAKPAEVAEEFEIEVVQAGDNPAFHEEDADAVRNVYAEVTKKEQE